jgi:hypothetical protein
MKGFPNQISDLEKLTRALHVAAELLKNGKNVRSDEVFGEALVRSGVAGTGHKAMPIDDYLTEQKKKPASNRSFQTTARLLRELFRVLDLVRDNGNQLYLTPAGEQILAQNEHGMTPKPLPAWRTVIHSMSHHGGYGGVSHPYQVLLRLLAKRPGLARAKCALALEAKDDSSDELDRIVSLSDLDEVEIRKQIGSTKSNWDNAKKILPSFAEQLGDATKSGQHMYLSSSPGEFVARTMKCEEDPGGFSLKDRPPKPRSARQVGVDTIARAGTLEDYDEIDFEASDSNTVQTRAKRRAILLDRLKRHNLIVQRLADVCHGNGAELYEDPFDCLACFEGRSLLVEVKSLDGSEADERNRVREALSQLLYYEAFVTSPYVDNRTVLKIALFESKISADHSAWLEASDILTLWLQNDSFVGNSEAISKLSPYLDDAIAES